MSVLHLRNFINHEKSRREVSFAEVAQLISVFQGFNISTDHDLGTEVSFLIEKDINTQEEFDHVLKLEKESSFALKTNKNQQLFTLAKNKVDKGFDFYSKSIFANNNLNPLKPNNFDDDSANGSSVLNVIQIIFLAAFRVKSSIETLNDLSSHLDNEAYDVMTSPVIQGVKAPKNFSEFSGWFYYDQYNQELITPSLGYAFGGSRADSRYNKKEFALQDCSSSVAKFVNSTGTFATYAMKMAAKNECKGEKLCNNVKVSLELKSQENAVSGDVFVIKSHTGFIFKILDSRCFTGLSYNRDIPKIEGVGYQDVCCEQNECLFFGVIDSLSTHSEEL